MKALELWNAGVGPSSTVEKSIWKNTSQSSKKDENLKDTQGRERETKVERD